MINRLSDGVLLGGVQCKADIIVGIAPTSVRRSCAVSLNRHHRHPALIAGGIAPVAVKRPGGFRFVKSAVGIIREHGMAFFGAYPEHRRNENRLIVVTGERRGFVLLNQCALAAALAAGADFQRLGRFYHEGLVVAAVAEGGGNRLRHVQRPGVPGILRVVFKDRRRNHARAKRRRFTFLIADAPGLR